ncbi:MAG: response regulator [Methylomonas sp.]|nr:response regulator [Methylomonas sp.]
MQFENRLEQLREKFADDLPDRLADIKRLYCEELIHGDRQEALHMALHRLTGLAGTFKAHRISELARSIELQYAPYPADTAKETPSTIATLFQRLEQAVHQYLDQPKAIKDDTTCANPLIRPPKLISLIQDAPVAAGEIASALEEAGYRVEIHPSLKSLAAAIQHTRTQPSLIIIDEQYTTQDEGNADSLSELRQEIKDFPPVVLISTKQDTLSRIYAQRAGISEYLVKPLSNSDLTHVVARYLKAEANNKILIIDDDAICADYIAYIIQNAGMQPKVLVDPFQVFETLKDFEPDLLILDINMPGCNGIELAQVIRQCCCYNLMPIIFLTTGSDIDRDLCALNSGGDELILKTESNEHFLRKITSRLRRHRQARQVNEQLSREQQRSERLRKSQRDFLTYVVHELKSPLHIMLGFGELLKMNEDLDAEQLDMVEEIIRGGQTQLAIINDLSEQIKIASGKLTLNIDKLDIIPLLNNIITDASLLGLTSNIRIHADFDAAEARLVKADSRRLEQILNNLLSNAIKYNKPAGTVSVNLQNRSNGMLRINVIDTGIGIADDDLEFVFEAFERFSHHRQTIEGTGIGLSICKQLIELMSGRIGVNSQPNIGSQFWIELPLARE